MKKLLAHIILTLPILLVWISCGKESSCFKGSGNEITELRNITNDVTEIVLEDKIDLHITQGNEIALRLEGGENLLPYINTDISGNVLTLTSDNKCGFFRDYNMPLTAYVTLPNINKITSRGQSKVMASRQLNFPDLTFEFFNSTGDIDLDLNSNNISIIQHTGPTNVTLRGNTNNLYVYSGGNGWFYLNGLSAKSVHVNHDGTGDITVKADSTLLVELTSIGNINYYGSPLVTISNNSGSGKLVKK